jgi:hypothetical protein
MYTIAYQRRNGEPGLVGRDMAGTSAPDAIDRWLKRYRFEPDFYDDVEVWIVLPSKGASKESILYRQVNAPRLEPITSLSR